MDNGSLSQHKTQDMPTGGEREWGYLYSNKSDEYINDPNIK